MIRRLSKFQRYVLANLLEESKYKENVKNWNFQVDETPERFLKPSHKRLDARKDDSWMQCEEIFDKIGWCTLAGSDEYIVIGIKKFKPWIKELIWDLKFEIKYKIDKWSKGREDKK